MEKFITAAGCAIRISDSAATRRKEHGKDQGADKPVLLLLHGYLESLEVWEDFIPLLAEHMRVIAIDLPGHGISEVKGEIHTMEFLADTVKGALDTLGIEKCFMAGHSMGGYAGLEFLRKYPGMLSGFILFHSTPNADSAEKKEERQREVEIVLAGKKELLAPLVEHRFAAGNRQRMADAIEDMKEMAALTEDAGIVAILRGMAARSDLNDMMHASKVPQLFIFGRHDEHIPEKVATALIDRHPLADVVWLENSGHMGMVEERALSARAVLDFCEKYS